ncbi:hypothetical protein [Paenibacillus agricola]|nr:hypothetical protein [Paenibacillus agricola]
MRDRKVLALDEHALLLEVQTRAQALLGRTGIILPQRFPMH